MKLSSILILSIILIKGLESRPGRRRQYSFKKPSSRVNYDSTRVSFGKHSDGDSSSSSSSSSISNSSSNNTDGKYSESRVKCPKINTISGNTIGISITCVNGKLYINNMEAKTEKSTDLLDITSNNLYINGKFSCHIPPKSSESSGNSDLIINTGNNVNTSSGKACPGLIMIGCTGLSQKCKNGVLYINDEKVADVRSNDRVELISNNLTINGNFMGHFKPRSTYQGIYAGLFA